MFFFCLIGYQIFLPLYKSNNVIIDYGINPFNICIEQPLIWNFCKSWFVFTYIFTSFFISNIFVNLFRKLFTNYPKNIKEKKSKLKKEKINYSLINSKPQDEKLELLIR